MSNATDRFGNEIDKIIDYMRKEYEISYAEVVGILMFKAHMLMRELEDDAEIDS
jgi:hypothetical protein